MKKAFIAMTIALTPFVSGLTQETYRPGSITSKERQIFVIHADKTHERYMQMTTEITTTAGIEERGEIVLSYQSALETLDVTEATTVQRERNVCRPGEQFHWEAFHGHLQRDIRSQIFFE